MTLLKRTKLPTKEYKNIVFGYSSLFASLETNEIIIWDIYDGKQINKFESQLGYFSNVTFSSDGKYILIVDAQKIIKLYELAFFQEILSFETQEVFDIAIDHSSELIAISNSNNSGIKLWSIKDNREAFFFEDYQYSKSSVTFSPNAKVLALGNYYSDRVKMLDVTSKQLIHSFSGIHSNGDLVFSTDGKLIAGESYYRDAVVLFDVDSEKELNVLEEIANFHNSEITCIAFSSNNKLIASGSYDLTIRLWEVASGKQVKILEGHKTTIFNLSFINNDKNLVSGSADCTICLWQI